MEFMEKLQKQKDDAKAAAEDYSRITSGGFFVYTC